jgi:hypothetical protein
MSGLLKLTGRDAISTNRVTSGDALVDRALAVASTSKRATPLSDPQIS